VVEACPEPSGREPGLPQFAASAPAPPEQARGEKTGARQPTEKNLGGCTIRQLQRSFVVPIRSGPLRMTASKVFPQPVSRPSVQRIPLFLARHSTPDVARSRISRYMTRGIDDFEPLMRNLQVREIRNGPRPNPKGNCAVHG
jgi:hypothetical protein